MISLLALGLIGAAPPQDSLEVDVEGLRSARGTVRLCLTANPGHFPDCTGDATARHVIVPADGRSALFTGLPAGDYAVALIHDENGNARLDRMMGIPREGVGFSGNPVLRFGPPRFAAARFRFDGHSSRQSVRVKYFL